MSRVFFTSDLHFGHNNICVNHRGMTVEENDKLIIKNWNNKVSKRDIVYILGDITMEKHKFIEDYLNQLQGDIRIIGGNHDNKRCVLEYVRLGIPVLGCLEYKGFICTHIPVHSSQVQFYRGNIHGHIHIFGSMEGPGFIESERTRLKYYNVNTEFHGYAPVLFTDIENEFISRNNNLKQ